MAKKKTKDTKLEAKKLRRGKKAVRRATGTTKLLEAFGVVRKKTRVGKTRAGAGRPPGTYKYGIPIQQYKKLQSRKKTLQDIYQQKRMEEFRRKGLSPEQVQQLQYVNVIHEGGVPVDRLETPQSVMGVADEELAFTKFRAEKTIHPKTQALLRGLRRIQLKGQKDDTEMQRRLNERRMISDASNLMKAHENMRPVHMDFTGVSRDNVLSAPNVFRENPEDNMLKQKRPSILHTKEVGNNLRF